MSDWARLPRVEADLPAGHVLVVGERCLVLPRGWRPERPGLWTRHMLGVRERDRDRRRSGAGPDVIIFAVEEALVDRPPREDDFLAYMLQDLRPAHYYRMREEDARRDWQDTLRDLLGPEDFLRFLPHLTEYYPPRPGSIWMVERTGDRLVVTETGDVVSFANEIGGGGGGCPLSMWYRTTRLVAWEPSLARW